MSKLTDMAAEEEARVEAEEAAAAATATDEPAQAAEPEPEAVSVSEPVAIDEKALERALVSHEKAMRKVMGEDFDALAPCDACGGVGYTPPNVETVPELKHDPMTETCEACNGWGQVLTGALEGASPLRPCTTCNNSGYVTKAVELPAGVPLQPIAGTAPGTVQPVSPPVNIDPTAIEELRRAGFTIIEPYSGGPVAT